MREDQNANGAELDGAQTTTQTADGIRANFETLPKVPACLGPPPAIDGEDADAYQQSLAMVIDVVRPVDIMDWFWVRDIVDLQWEILRFRRAKANYLIKTAKQPLERAALLKEEFAARLRGHDDDDSPLAAVELDISDVLKVVMNSSDQIGRIERIVAAMEARRDKAFREIERHRSKSSVRSRRAAKQIEDAEYRVITNNNPAQDHAA